MRARYFNAGTLTVVPVVEEYMFREINQRPRGLGNAGAALVRAGVAVAHAAVSWERRTLTWTPDAVAPLEGATAWLNSEPVGTTHPARQGDPGSVLDLQLHRVAVGHVSVCPRLGGEIQEQRVRVAIGVHTPEYSFRARRRECPGGRRRA